MRMTEEESNAKCNAIRQIVHDWLVQVRVEKACAATSLLSCISCPLWLSSTLLSCFSCSLWPNSSLFFCLSCTLWL